MGPSEDVARAIRELHARGSAAWPGVDLDMEAFEKHVEEKLASRPSEDVSTFRADGIYLAAACALRIEPAVRALRGRYHQRLVGALARAGSNDARDDVLQRVYERVLVRGRDGKPDIVRYDGRGDLGAWLVTVAVREAYRVVRESRHVGHGEPADNAPERDLELAVERSDQELLYLKAHYREHFKEAFRAAMRDLASRERNLLRYQYMHALSYEEIATVYGVGRATAARWLAAAKKALLDHTRERLKQRLGCAEGELDSVMKLVESQLDLTLTGLMAPTASQPER